MNNSKLIILVALSFSFLVNIPRIVFLFGNRDTLLGSILEISVQDVLFRFISVFGFCFIVLKLNVSWLSRWFGKYIFWVGLPVSMLVLVIWLRLFHILDRTFYGVTSTLSPKFNAFVYFFVMLMLLVVRKAIALLEQSKADAIEKERLKRQSAENELMALKNQVNPHFLFNSLNSLGFLIREDQEAALKFVSRLSYLYRYTLQNKSQNLVALKEEIKFLESYSFLIKQRYRDNFSLDISITRTLISRRIPSLALQLLVENAVKHNEISANRPLAIAIYDEGGYIVVKNKLQKRNGPLESTHTGLSNLNNRFELLLGKEIVIENNKDFFIVKLPI